jgi:transposase
MTVFMGDDWAEDHHDVYLMDDAGKRLASRRLPEGLDGIRVFHELVADHVVDPAEVIVGIETDRGLWVTALVAVGYQVYAINPLAASRYRDRHNVGGAKSDAGDAKMLADLVRTDRHNHRQIAGDTPDAEAIRIIARGHQNLIWTRTRQTNALRSALREYYPAALETFADLADRDTLAVLAKAPTPVEGARLTLGQIQAALKRGGRQRNLERRATEIQTTLRVGQLAAPDAVADAFGATTRAAVGIITELNRQITQLEATLTTNFEQHPDADIYHSLPGFGVVLGARALGEFGDDPNRYANTKSRRNYAGTSPLTIASGKKKAVLARHVRNRRLYDALDQAAFCSLTQSPGCRLFYDQHRTAGDLHHQALRALANRLVGILHGCLEHHSLYNEHTAWAHRQPAAAAKENQQAA